MHVIQYSIPGRRSWFPLADTSSCQYPEAHTHRSMHGCRYTPLVPGKRYQYPVDDTQLDNTGEPIPTGQSLSSYTGKGLIHKVSTNPQGPTTWVLLRLLQLTYSYTFGIYTLIARSHSCLDVTSFMCPVAVVFYGTSLDYTCTGCS